MPPGEARRRGRGRGRWEGHGGQDDAGFLHAGARASHESLTECEELRESDPGNAVASGDHLSRQTLSRRNRMNFARPPRRRGRLALVPAGSAFAATINGGPGNERLRGTNAADLIDGNAGNDRIFGRARRRPAHRRRGHDRSSVGRATTRSPASGQRPAQRRRRRRHHHRRRERDRRPDLLRPPLRRGGQRHAQWRRLARPDLRRLGQRHDLRRERQRPHGRRTGDDVQDGGKGNDRIFANLGADTSTAATATTTCGRWPAATCTPAPTARSTGRRHARRRQRQRPLPHP